jgi:8-oxo-dGTP pyrophosphatase MutT (NUDIX family)
MPSRWKPNVTVAAIIDRTVDGRHEFLLVEEETSEGLRLNNPAGHLDPGETPQHGAEREAFEETACRFTPDSLLGIYLSRVRRPANGADVTYLRVAFGGHAAEPEPGRALDAGIVRTLWMSLAEVRASRDRHRSPLVLRCIEDRVAGRRWPLDVVYSDPSVFAGDVDEQADT